MSSGLDLGSCRGWLTPVEGGTLTRLERGDDEGVLGVPPSVRGVVTAADLSPDSEDLYLGIDLTEGWDGAAVCSSKVTLDDVGGEMSMNISGWHLTLTTNVGKARVA